MEELSWTSIMQERTVKKVIGISDACENQPIHESNSTEGAEAEPWSEM